MNLDGGLASIVTDRNREEAHDPETPFSELRTDMLYTVFGKLFQGQFSATTVIPSTSQPSTSPTPTLTHPTLQSTNTSSHSIFLPHEEEISLPFRAVHQKPCDSASFQLCADLASGIGPWVLYPTRNRLPPTPTVHPNQSIVQNSISNTLEQPTMAALPGARRQ